MWVDPEESESHTNQYIEDNLTEQKDYTIISPDNYNILSSYFGSLFDIKRKGITFCDEAIVEVNLNKVDFFIKLIKKV